MSKNKFYMKQHKFYLNKIYNNVGHLDINREDVNWILKEGVWYKPNSFEQLSLCDLIICNEDNTAIPVELKGSWNQQTKAMKQLGMGCKFAYYILNKEPIYSIMAVYNKNTIQYERYEVN